MSAFPLISLLLFSFSFIHAEAKFSREVFRRPCTLITFEVISCKDAVYSNEAKKAPLEYRGILIEAQIKDNQPTKCRANHEMDLNLFQKNKKHPGRSSLFVRGANCKEPPTKATKTNQFCDTPGANSVPECFIGQLEAREKFGYTISEIYP